MDQQQVLGSAVDAADSSSADAGITTVQTRIHGWWMVVTRREYRFYSGR